MAQVMALEPSVQVVWYLLLVLLLLGRSFAMVVSQVSVLSSTKVRLEKLIQTIC
jgi:hypothetical protein